MVLHATTDSDREDVMSMYHKSKITVDDMMREYTPEEVRMLCERTKLRVQMYRMNSVWDAKKRFDKKKRLENKSERFVNRMLVKAHNRKMVTPYSDLERDKYKELAACHTKKDNNVRLDRWQRQRLKALDRFSKEPPAPVNVLSNSSSESEPEAEMATQSPISSSEPAPAPVNVSINNSSELKHEAEMLTQSPIGSFEPAPAPLESQSQSQSDETTMNDFIQPVIPPPARKALPDQDSDQNLWGIGDLDEMEESEDKGGPPAAVAETQMDIFDWKAAAQHINSESLSMQSIVCTQNTEPDYDTFGTQVVAASTQDTVESQPFYK
ncbi:telomere-binding protein cav isoform X2 [Drosophila serrata]|nr:telomere-binding protein cav isoform X2 [Drosophila serrata]